MKTINLNIRLNGLLFNKEGHELQIFEAVNASFEAALQSGKVQQIGVSDKGAPVVVYKEINQWVADQIREYQTTGAGYIKKGRIWYEIKPCGEWFMLQRVKEPS